MIAFITGSGFYEFPGLKPVELATRFGQARYLTGEIEGKPVIVLPRHGEHHRFLPHQIPHLANLMALKEAGVSAIVSCSVCGIVNPDWPIGAPLIANDLWFPENRLGDGSTCTTFDEPGKDGRGHLLATSFFNEALSNAIQRHFESSSGSCSQGCYAHANGPRFNSKAEIRGLRSTGVDFLSQTCGPEAVLANELELPYALAGFGVDYANGVQSEPTPIQTLQENLGHAKEAFTSLVHSLIQDEEEYSFENFVYRFD